MAADQLVVVSGTVDDEQDMVQVLDNILVHVYGWELVAKVTDTASDKEWWWRSEGEDPGTYMRLYCGVQGDANDLHIKAATYVTSGGSISDEVHDSVENETQFTSQRDYWVVGNKDVVHIFHRSSSDDNYFCGFGYFDTYYTFAQDPYPVFVYGQNNSADTFQSTRRLNAYAVSPLSVAANGGVSGGHFLGTVSSGTNVSYVADDLSTLVQLNAPGIRDGRYAALKPVFYREENQSLSTHEVRGEVPFMYQVWGDAFSIGDVITASGVVTEQGVGTDDKFIATTEFGQQDNTFIFGPIEDFDLTSQAIPYSNSNLQLYLAADAGIERNGGAFTGGTVSAWRDQSSHPNTPSSSFQRNDATQGTEANQPTPVENVINQKPIVRFNNGSSQEMSGTFDIDNDMTLFAVASYSNGSNRTPILNVRGDVSAADTLFSIEFNENASDSATVVNIAGGGTDREEVTGLSADTFYIITNTVSGTDTTLFVDGFDGNSSTITDTKGSVASSATLTYRVGVNSVSGGGEGSTYADADIAEILVYDKYLTNEERQTIHCYLSDKYGITVSGTC